MSLAEAAGIVLPDAGFEVGLYWLDTAFANTARIGRPSGSRYLGTCYVGEERFEEPHAMTKADDMRCSTMLK